MSEDAFRLIGSVLDGKYRIEDILGEGGHGIVYGGTHVLLEAPIAIKVLKPFHVGADAKKARELFLREARILFAIGHPAIVRLYDVGSLQTPLGPTPYVVLERIEGRTLSEEIARRIEAKTKLSQDELRTIFDPVLDALAFAHEAGVIHRDLKPSNIMLLGDGRSKILDFGVARWGESESTSKEGPRTGFTAAYAAPEQWISGGDESPAVDVFSIGLVMIEALTLERIAAPALASGSKLDLLTTTRPEMPLALLTVLDRATTTTPKNRYASARELRDAWDASLGTSRAIVPMAMPSHHPDTFAETEVHAPRTPIGATIPPQKQSRVRFLLPIALFSAGVAGTLAIEHRPRQSVAAPAASVVTSSASAAPVLMGTVRTTVLATSNVYGADALPKLSNAQLLACYTDGLKRHPALTGEVAILAGVKSTGEVHKAIPVDAGDANKSKLEDDGVQHCVAKAIEDLSYPPHKKDDVIGVLYVFFFHPTRLPDPPPADTDPDSIAGMYDQTMILKSTGQPFPTELTEVRRYGHRVTQDYPDGTMACWYDGELACRWLQVDSNGRATLARKAGSSTWSGSWGFDPSDSNGGTWRLVRRPP